MGHYGVRVQSPNPVLVVVTAILCGLAVGITAWNVSDGGLTADSAARTRLSTSPSPHTSTTTSDQPTTQAGSRHSANDAALRKCVRLFDRQVATTLAADTSLDQWRRHILAMNQLVAGQITLTQAQQYWNRTRLGAHRNVRTFKRLQRTLDTLHCPQAATASPRLAPCHRAIQAYHDALEAAATTIDTWNMHIRDMDALRAGRITPQKATKMWIRSWHVGARQLRDYHRELTAAVPEKCV